MKIFLSSCLLLATFGSTAVAGPCEDRFIELFTQQDQGIATKAFNTTEFKGAPAMTNEFYYLSQSHNMSVPVSPPQPRVLTHGTVMYQSSDEGKTWVKVRDLEAPASAEEAAALKLKDAETLRNALCDHDEIDGVAYERIAGDITLTQGMTTENRYTYWVRKDNGFIARAVYDTKAPNFEMKITQDIEPAPDLELPVPE